MKVGSVFLDTREKIVPVGQLAERLGTGAWLAAVGTFDPLTLSQAERLAKLSENGQAVLAVVEPGNGCLLPLEARAILVAALQSVKLVVATAADALPQLPQVKIVRDDEGERQRSVAFVEHVRGRQGA
jgi:hypothetical protein